MPHDSSWLSTISVKGIDPEEVTRARAANRAENQKRQLNQIFSKHLDATGNLDERSFYQEATAAGLGPEHVQTAMDWYSKKKGAQVATQQANNQLRMAGADPNAAGRNNATIGAPADVLSTEAPAEAPSSKLNDWWQRLKGRANPLQEKPAEKQSLTVAAPPAPADQQVASEPQAKTEPMLPRSETPTQAAVVPNWKAEALRKFLGMKPVTADAPAQAQASAQAQPEAAPETTDERTVNIHAFQLPAPPMRDDNAPRAITPPDNRSAEQKVEDSYQKSNSAFGAVGNVVPPDGDYKKLFNYDAVTAGNNGIELKQALDNSLRKLGKEPGQESINAVLQLADSTVPPPEPVLTETGAIDMGKTRQAQIEYPAKVAAARQKAIQDLVSGNTTAIGEMFTQDSQRLAQLNQQNEAREKTASNAGVNSLAAKTSEVGNKYGLKGKLDPTTFKSIEELSKFSQQTTAYAELVHQIELEQKSGQTDPLFRLNFAKNYAQAEGLGEAEGTRNLAMLLSETDPTKRQYLMQAVGHGGGVLERVVTNFIAEFAPSDLSKLVEGMKFSKDWEAHTGEGQLPEYKPFSNEPATQPPAGGAGASGAAGAGGAGAADELRKKLGMKDKKDNKKKGSKPYEGMLRKNNTEMYYNGAWHKVSK